MNERKQPISGNSRRRPIIGDDASAPGSEKSIIVFCGDAQRVSDGFALALSVMEANADQLMMGPKAVLDEED